MLVWDDEESSKGTRLMLTMMLTDVMTKTDQMINIMRAMSEGEQGSETARTRVQVLSEFL